MALADAARLLLRSPTRAGRPAAQDRRRGGAGRRAAGLAERRRDRAGGVVAACGSSSATRCSAWSISRPRASAPGADRIVEVGAVRVEGYELAGGSSGWSIPGVPLPAEITRMTGIRPQDVAGRVRDRVGAARVPGVRRRRRAGGAQRALRRRLRRRRAAPPARPPLRRHGARHGAAGPQAGAGPHALLAGRARRPLLHRRRRRATGRCPTRWPRPRSCWPDRQGAGARRRDGRRPGGAVGAARPPGARQARAGRGGAAHAGHLRDARRRRPGALRRRGRRPAAAHACRTSAAPARRGRSSACCRPSSGSSSARPARRSRPGSTRSG